MAPVRTRGAGPAVASTSKANDQIENKQKRDRKHQHHRKHKDSEDSPAGLPGVQKIKSALRQTRRLLAKDKLAADVRTKTERRLKALEADLVQAEQARKERAIAQRYHAVKFFERQKVTRRIQQVKRQLAKDENSEGEKLRKKERKQLQKRLEELRVDLNYIIYYPKLKKYISLFPPELRASPHAHPDPYPHLYSRSDAPGEDAKAENETDAQREEVRAWVRERMAAGEMSAEPEVELRERERHKDRQMTARDRQLDEGLDKAKVKGEQDARPAVLEGDEFFGDDGGSEESGGGGDGEDEEMNSE
ncbi:uncharacterized protein B0H18DRAFT_1121102 [Fomitopsis serialis]|uniref:uncharacterized protein n=1 Tax=Fomitopsis serialis TaxID=139415 RepID=UPI002007C365|nr:uncharacterized protein B0H18DRAFT_1121102 [Neoantrodia serialis]KAH9922081.1 hypothetical protein B0H18DRAFT_1121102 [Neoantrodia serialis]